MSNLYFITQQMMMFSIPLMMVALAGMFSERSGVVNIALEGTMVIGAFAGTMTLYFLQGRDILQGYPALFVAMLVAILAGLLFAAFHAFASINMFADQTISGTALNLFASAFCIFVSRSIVGVQQVPFRNQFLIPKVPVLGDIPVIGSMFFQNAYLTTYLGFLLLIISSVVLYKTRFGLRLRSAGEFPQATDAAGVSVKKIRWAGVLISGAIGALGGLVYITPIATEFNATVSGYGFLAIAVLIFGQWKPKYIVLAALFFGLLKTVAAAYTGIPFLMNLNIPKVVYQITPYIMTIVALFFVSERSAAPASLGEPFDKGKR